jgi:hypothetical protein
MCAVSRISSKKVDSPRARLSPAPDAREHAVADADARERAGHEAAHLGHDGRQRDLADQRRLARHVGPGDEQHLLAVGVEAHVVGHEAARGGQALDDGMAAVDKVDDLGIFHHGPAVVVAMGLLGQRGQHVGGGHAAGQGQQPLRHGADLIAQTAEDPSSMLMRLSSAVRILAS